MALKTRKPTGRAGYPKLLVEGTEFAGKSWALGELSGDERIGKTVILALGEDITRWDEYGQIPGARFELILHDGTWTSIIEAVKDAKAEAAEARDKGEPPYVLGIDTMTAVWEGLKDWATYRARNSKRNKELLDKDPDAEIDVTSNYWNDARGRHRQLMRLLLTFPGIVILIARGNEVTLFRDGKPVAGKTTWSIDSERNLPFDVSAHIRLSRESRPLLISSRGIHCQIQPGVDKPKPLPDDWSLAGVIFDMLKLDAKTAEVREVVDFKQELTPEQIRDEVVKPETTLKRIQELWPVVNRNFPAVEVDGEPLLDVLKREGDKRLAAEKQQRQQEAVKSALTPAELKALGDWGAMVEAIAGPADEEMASAEVDEAEKDGRLDEVKAAAVRKAIKARVAAVAAVAKKAAAA